MPKNTTNNLKPIDIAMKTNLAPQNSVIPSPYSEEADLVRIALLEQGLETPLLPHQYERDEKY